MLNTHAGKMRLAGLGSRLRHYTTQSISGRKNTNNRDEPHNRSKTVSSADNANRVIEEPSTKPQAEARFDRFVVLH